MINKLKTSRVISIGLSMGGLILLTGTVCVNAQTRDPFKKPGYAVPRTHGPIIPGKPGTSGPAQNMGAPSIAQRIDYYKRLREQAALNGSAIPKVTSVLTLDEMAVIGIFRTPRGYAAMVEATPIKLSYTIYPGEKFFDGQLVAVEENRLVFRKVVKMSNGKFVSSVENKALRQYSTKELVEGTAPMQSSDGQGESLASAQPAASSDVKPAAPVKIVSPLEEMNKSPQPNLSEKDKTAKPVKKPVKVAKNKK